MKPSTLIALLLIVVGAAAYWNNWTPRPQPQPTPERPSAALVAAVQPVIAILKNHREDGLRLSAFYAAVADVLTRDQGEVIKTTLQLRELHRRAGLLAFQRTEIVGKYPGLSDAIDKVLVDQVGLDNVTMDSAHRAKAIDAFKALAWACGGGDG